MNFRTTANLIFATLCLSSALAASDGTRGGGDPVALEFQKSALDAIQDIKSRPDRFPQLRFIDLNEVLKSAKIYVVETPLAVRTGDITQIPAVVNEKSPNRIIIHREGWRAEPNRTPAIRKALALHELLGLVGLEETGVYTICQTYLKEFSGEGTHGRPSVIAVRVEDVLSVRLEDSSNEWCTKQLIPRPWDGKFKPYRPKVATVVTKNSTFRRRDVCGTATGESQASYFYDVVDAFLRGGQPGEPCVKSRKCSPKGDCEDVFGIARYDKWFNFYVDSQGNIKDFRQDWRVWCE